MLWHYLADERAVRCRYVLGWEDAGAEALQDAGAMGSSQLSAQTAKAKRQSKAAARNEKAAAGFPLRVSAVRSVAVGKEYDKDTAPQTQNLVAATAELAQEWVEVINQALRSMAHDTMPSMSIGAAAGDAPVSARAVKLLVVRSGLPGQANTPKVGLPHLLPRRVVRANTPPPTALTRTALTTWT